MLFKVRSTIEFHDSSYKVDNAVYLSAIIFFVNVGNVDRIILYSFTFDSGFPYHLSISFNFVTFYLTIISLCCLSLS